MEIKFRLRALRGRDFTLRRSCVFLFVVSVIGGFRWGWVGEMAFGLSVN